MREKHIPSLTSKFPIQLPWDLYVPSICGDKLYEYLKEINADVEYIHEDIAHEKMIIRMIMDFYKYLYPNQ